MTHSRGNSLKVGSSTASPDELLKGMRRQVAQWPDDAGGHYQLGTLLSERHQWSDAAAAFRKAVNLKPAMKEAYLGLAHCWLKLGLGDQALEVYQEGIKNHPRWPAPHMRLGMLYRRSGRLDNAIYHFRRALQLDPHNHKAVLNTGAMLAELSKTPEAEAVYRGYLAEHAPTAQVLCNLGNLLLSSGRLDEACACYRQGLELKPDTQHLFKLLNNLGNALFQTGEKEKIEEAFTCYERAAEVAPNAPTPLSNMCMVMHYFDHFSLEQMREVAERSSSRWPRYPLQGGPAQYRASGRLRIGYLSADFITHPVAFFLRGLWKAHDRRKVEVFAYSNRRIQDRQTSKLQECCDHWRPVAGLSDAALAARVIEDGIDVLVDLSGFTGGHRMGVFALKPAPVQVSWLGYFGTTGLAEMDYILADRFVVPESHESCYTEKVWRMPGSYLCYSPPPYDVPVADAPALESGSVTFGCFNNRAKLSDAVLSLWARLLLAVPDSRLLLKYRQYDDAKVCDIVRGQFTRRGVEPDRVCFEGASPHPDFFESYHKVDIALDPYPFGGGTTTAESLWMGVPVVSLMGDRWVGRVTPSILHAAGLGDLVAESEDEYLEIASRLALNLDTLLEQRRGLRERLLQSELCNAPRFAAELESAFLAMCQQSAAND